MSFLTSSVAGQQGGTSSMSERDFSSEAHARAVFVAAVGFSAAIPEAEGLVVGFGIEKSREIGGVVYIGNAFCGGIEFEVVVFGANEFAR